MTDEAPFARELYHRCEQAMDRYVPGTYSGDAIIFYCEKYKDPLDQPNYSSKRIIYPWSMVIGEKLTAHTLKCEHAGLVKEEYSLVAQFISTWAPQPPEGASGRSGGSGRGPHKSGEVADDGFDRRPAMMAPRPVRAP